MGARPGQLLDRWLIECERLDLSPTTMRTYRSQIETTIRPALGKVALTRLSAKNLDDLYGAMKTAKKDPRPATSPISKHVLTVDPVQPTTRRWDLVERYNEGSPDGFGNTFGQLLDRWLRESGSVSTSRRQPRTYRRDEKNYLACARQVELSLSPRKHWTISYGAMKERGLSAKTIRNHHAIISSALHQAVRWGWVRDNVAEHAKPPRIAQHRVKAPSVDVVRAIITSAEDRDPRLAPLLMLGALTGCGAASSARCAGPTSTSTSGARRVPLRRRRARRPRREDDQDGSLPAVALDDVGGRAARSAPARVDEWAGDAEARRSPTMPSSSRRTSTVQPVPTRQRHGLLCPSRATASVSTASGCTTSGTSRRRSSSAPESTCAPLPGRLGIPTRR